MSTKGRDDFERVLAAPGLYDRQGQETAACPSPETLAAFVDQGLEPSERARCEAHVADCARCQMTLATIVRASDAVASQGVTVRPRLGWMWWLAPAGLATAAAVAWFAVRPVAPSLAPQTGADEVAIATSDSRVPEVPGAVTAQPQAPPRAQEGKAQAGRPETRTARKDDVPSARVAQKAAPAESDLPAMVAARDEAVGLRETVSLQAEAGKGAPATAPAVEPPAVGTVAPTPPAPAAPQFGATRVTAVVPEKPGAIAETPSNEARASSVRRAIIAAPIVVVTPSSEVRWRLDPDGRILRREAASASWQLVYADSSLRFVAAVSPSPQVCWAVTSRDVLVTRDGRTWHRHQFPDDIAIAWIAAADGSTATVTTAGGLRFTTTDGGTTWQLNR